MTDTNKVMRAFQRLSPDSQGLVASLIERLAKGGGVETTADYKPPAENIPLWTTKLKGECRPRFLTW